MKKIHDGADDLITESGKKIQLEDNCIKQREKEILLKKKLKDEKKSV